MDEAGRRQAAVRAYVKLHRASRALVGAVEPRIAAAGLTPTQFGVMEALRQTSCPRAATHT